MLTWMVFAEPVTIILIETTKFLIGAFLTFVQEGLDLLRGITS